MRGLTVAERLVARSIPEPNSGCWLWLGAVDRDGYGHFAINGVHIRAHRASFMAFRGPLKPGMYVCHKCDVPSCINPGHLFQGTPTDNARDMGRKGRVWMGRLCATDVLSIRASELPAKALAASFDVHIATIHQIRRRHTWRTI